METRAHKTRRDNRSLNQDLPISRIRLATLKALNDFHLLDTLLLYKLVERDVGTLHYGRFQNGLTDVRKKGGYITCPPAQFQTFNADYKRLVYQLTDRGKTVLKNHGIPVYSWGTHSSSFAHDWMMAHCMASIYLGADSKFISPAEIASRATVKENPFKFPVRSLDQTVAPDFPVFGFEYDDGHNFFIFEMDCNTEIVETENFDRASLAKKITAYNELDKPDSRGDNAFWHRLRITNNYVGIITTDELQKRRIIQKVKQMCGKSKMFFIRTIPHFSTLDYTPDAMPELWSTGWERVGYDPFFLNKVEE